MVLAREEVSYLGLTYLLAKYQAEQEPRIRESYAKIEAPELRYGQVCKDGCRIFQQIVNLVLLDALFGFI